MVNGHAFFFLEIFPKVLKLNQIREGLEKKSAEIYFKIDLWNIFWKTPFFQEYVNIF